MSWKLTGTKSFPRQSVLHSSCSLLRYHRSYFEHMIRPQLRSFFFCLADFVPTMWTSNWCPRCARNSLDEILVSSLSLIPNMSENQCWLVAEPIPHKNHTVIGHHNARTLHHNCRWKEVNLEPPARYFGSRFCAHNRDFRTPTFDIQISSRFDLTVIQTVHNSGTVECPWGSSSDFCSALCKEGCPLPSNYYDHHKETGEKIWERKTTQYWNVDQPHQHVFSSTSILNKFKER